MASLSPYTFHNTDRIGTDSTDQTQRNLSNTHYSNYLLTDHFSKMFLMTTLNLRFNNPL